MEDNNKRVTRPTIAFKPFILASDYSRTEQSIFSVVISIVLTTNNHLKIAYSWKRN